MILRGRTFRLLTDRAVFAARGLDRGTRLLIETMEVRPDDVILDLGCGYGVIGLVAATMAPRGHVHMVDINVRAVELVPLDEARRAIETAAREAVAAARKPAPVRRGPVEVRMRFDNVLVPEIAEAFPTIRRPQPDTIEFSAETMPAAYRLIRVLYRFINPD